MTPTRDAGPSSFDELVATPSRWLSGDGPHADLVLSTRVREHTGRIFIDQLDIRHERHTCMDAFEEVV